jgi:octopine/nopaline transport system permease protein
MGVVDDTLILALSSVSIGFFVAIPIALMRLSQSRLMFGLAYGYVYIFRSTPLLVQIFLIYYGSGQFRSFFESIGLWYLLRESWFCAIFALMLNTAAYTSEIIRGGIQSVPWGQIEAARAVGMSGFLLFQKDHISGGHPPGHTGLWQRADADGESHLPGLHHHHCGAYRNGKKIIAANYRPVEVFLIAGGIYLCINFIISRGIMYTEHR